MAKERIGILGGTFDPIHTGHIRMARTALESAGLDRVLILPTGNPPHKKQVSPAADRWRMICAALAREDGLEPCSIEMEREGVIYTVDTMAILKERYPKAELFYLIGADTLLELKNWRRYETVLKGMTFLVCPRPWDVQPAELTAERKRLEQLGGHFQDLPMTVTDASSTEIRGRLQRGEPTPDLQVSLREYALLAGLYGMTPRFPEAQAWLEKLFAALTPRRFSHSLSVACTARHLAAVHHLDAARTEAAGLLHDCAKCMSTKEMVRICQENGLTDDPMILESGALMHGPAGAWTAQHEYGVTDPEILDAIACHTTGKPGMTPMDMAVYLADKIEPERRDYPTLERVRVLAQLSLERAMLTSMEGTRDYVRKAGKPLHPSTLDTIAWLKKQPANKDNPKRKGSHHAG